MRRNERLVAGNALCYGAPVLAQVKAGKTMHSIQSRIWNIGLLALAAFSAAISVAAELPQLPGGLAAPKSPLNLPAFNLPTAAGTSIRSGDYKGRVIIARFWASW
jgi:hypothetical protein